MIKPGFHFFRDREFEAVTQIRLSLFSDGILLSKITRRSRKLLFSGVETSRIAGQARNTKNPVNLDEEHSWTTKILF